MLIQPLPVMFLQLKGYITGCPGGCLPETGTVKYLRAMDAE